jgi:hypothetical protein
MLAQSETTPTRLVHEEQLSAMEAVGIAILRLAADAEPFQATIAFPQ